MITNYQIQLEKILENIDKNDKPLLFLHCCCAPCSSYVLEYLSDYFDIIIYFFNPNIDSYDEYYKRSAELEKLVGFMGVSVKNLLVENYLHSEFLTAVSGYENDKEGRMRCEICFRLRLKKTFDTMIKYILENAVDVSKKIYFTTTLTISPLKNAEKINNIGKEILDKYTPNDFEYDINFLPSDFKKNNGYKRSCELSKIYNLYRQNFCGCEFSKINSVIQV